MQEEVTQKTIALSVNVGKGAARLTEQALQKAIKKFLEQRKSHTPHGKQTMRQLMKQNVGVSNIEITDSNIKSFERVARKYGVDFALKKDKSGDIPKYLVFFKARDADALTAAFKEYTAKEVRRASKDRPSVLEQLRALKAKLLTLTPDKSRSKDKGLEL